VENVVVLTSGRRTTTKSWSITIYTVPAISLLNVYLRSKLQFCNTRGNKSRVKFCSWSPS